MTLLCNYDLLVDVTFEHPEYSFRKFTVCIKLSDEERIEYLDSSGDTYLTHLAREIIRKYDYTDFYHTYTFRFQTIIGTDVYVEKIVLH